MNTEDNSPDPSTTDVSPANWLQEGAHHSIEQASHMARQVWAFRNNKLATQPQNFSILGGIGALLSLTGTAITLATTARNGTPANNLACRVNIANLTPYPLVLRENRFTQPVLGCPPVILSGDSDEMSLWLNSGDSTELTFDVGNTSGRVLATVIIWIRSPSPSNSSPLRVSRVSFNGVNYQDPLPNEGLSSTSSIFYRSRPINGATFSVITNTVSDILESRLDLAFLSFGG